MYPEHLFPFVACRSSYGGEWLCQCLEYYSVLGPRLACTPAELNCQCCGIEWMCLLKAYLRIQTLKDVTSL